MKKLFLMMAIMAIAAGILMTAHYYIINCELPPIAKILFSPKIGYW